MRKFRSLISVIVVLAFMITATSEAFADYEPSYPVTTGVLLDGTEYKVRGYSVAYDNNLYLSMTDLSAVLKNTDKKFSVSYTNTDTDGARYDISRGKTGTAALLIGIDARLSDWYSVQRNRLFIDGSEKRYYSLSVDNILYMSLTDIQLILDVTLEYVDEGVLAIYPDKPFSPDIYRLKAEDYFDGFNGIVLGDATTGQMIFAYNCFLSSSIASTSKLMTYLLTQEAIEKGTISSGDFVVISENTAELSQSADSTVKLTAGSKIPLKELLEVMLIASSNEAALAVAEHVAGSEDKFVEMMNSKAEELKLKTAKFYNPHGLPVYRQTSVSAKLQNKMSAGDMFRLASKILDDYPEITEITSKQYVTMPSLNNFCAANSNPLVFNLPGTTGLKTGSTNKAGYCLVVSYPVETEDGVHDLVAVVLGSERAETRGQVAEILIRYGILKLQS